MTKIKIGTGDWIVVCDGRQGAYPRKSRRSHVSESAHQGSARAPGPFHPRAGQRCAGQRAPVDGRRAKLDRADRLARRVRANIPQGAGRPAQRCRHHRRNHRADDGRLAARAGHDPLGLFGRGSQGDSWANSPRISSRCRSTRSRSSFWRETLTGPTNPGQYAHVTPAPIRHR